jgi:formylglycine-generating enzyme required for sulfatase activity
MLEVIEIPPGEYRVGNESIPNGSPQHRRRLHDPVWMDARPVSWDHFESFVVGGGYSTELLEGQSVDRRTRQLIEQSMEARMQSGRSTDPVLSQPVTGLTWFEAVEVAAFYRARLPYEIEWEIAHTSKSTDADTSDEPSGGPQSRFGLSILIGELQEWTLDAFSKTYWRADFDKRGVPWSRERPGSGVSVRGAGPGDMFRHVSYRFASAPNHTHVHRGFRRVWDSKPVDADIVPGWRR